MNSIRATAVLVVATLGASAFGADQTVPGAGNNAAIALASKSPIVQSAQRFLIGQAKQIHSDKLRNETLDAINNPSTCVKHRGGLSEADKKQILNALMAQGLVNPADDATFPGGLKAGVFPPLLDDGSSCPKLPQMFYSAPGSAYFGHHSYPGGLPVHESNNEVADVHLADEYRGVYGSTGAGGFPVVDSNALTASAHSRDKSVLYIDEDIIVGAPIWHDWGKPMVFQWNADGSEFAELNFGGNGVNDNYGAAGDSRTGGHHILGVAEAMKRGLDPAFVITQACAHSAPTSGNEYKVVNWLRAAAIIARIDPVQAGYLTMDGGKLRLPALRALGSISLLPSQTNLLAEYTLHNLSDADFTYSGPAVASADLILKTLAAQYGYNPANVTEYQTKFRNPALSFITGERLLILYSEQGLQGVETELNNLRSQGII